ncbi:MAG: fused MFS/spermidine synthase [Patescibacteria group bacterium]
MTWLSYLVPRTVLRTTSPYNRDIRIIEEWGKLKLLVNGSRQSGPYIKKLWEAAFRAFHLEATPHVTSILVLGVGGGTVIKLLADRYPQARITAVDIDSTIIHLAKEHFRLSEVAELRFILADAKAFVVAHARERMNYDLVVVDVFIGRDVPDFMTTPGFYQSLKLLLRPGGRVILNYLLELGYQKKSDALFLLLKRVFQDVGDYPCFNKSNRFFYARRRSSLSLDKRVGGILR